MLDQTKPQIVNGIDTALIAGLADGAARDSALAQTRWKVRTDWQGQTQTRSHVSSCELGGELLDRDFVIDIDEPTQLGGRNENANPQEVLLAAVNACILTTFAAQCAMRGIVIHSLSIETEGGIDMRKFLGLDETVPAGYKALDYTIRVDADAEPDTLHHIHEVVKGTSPNFYNMVSAIALNATLIV